MQKKNILYKSFVDNFLDLICIFFGVIFIYIIIILMGIPTMTDDAFGYQGFMENFVKNFELDFKSYVGWHGHIFITAPIFIVTKSSEAIIVGGIICSILNVPLSYIVGKKFSNNIYGGLSFMSCYILTPNIYIVSLRGFVEPIQFFFILLFFNSILDKSNFSFLFFSISITIKPWALALAPILINHIYINHEKKLKNILKSLAMLLSSFLILCTHIILTYFQTGQIMNSYAAGYDYESTFDFSINNMLENFYKFYYSIIDNSNIVNIKQPISSFLYYLIITHIFITIVNENWIWKFNNISNLKEFFRKNSLYISLFLTAILNFGMVMVINFYFFKYFLTLYFVIFLFFSLISKEVNYFLFIYILSSFTVFSNTYQTYKHLLEINITYFPILILFFVLIFVMKFNEREQ